MRLLLAMADGQASDLIKDALEEERHAVVGAGDPQAAFATALDGAFDLLLVDSGLDPDEDISLCRRLRDAGVRAPILVFSPDGATKETVAHLDAGADDVVPLSVAMPELLARVRALGRRHARAAGSQLQAGDLSLDVARHAAVRGREVVVLSGREFRLLEFLLRHQGQAVRREEIRHAVWPDERDYQSNIVDIYVHFLRNKIERRGETQLILTVPGVGYMLKA